MRQPAKTFADYLVVAFSPVLIMLLVGSLAFFLIQVLYRAEMVQGVRWVTFWFVFAIVLVSRIGIEQSKQHAVFYGVALAAATWVYLLYLHSAAMFGAILLAITWWCAHKLTVDCTLINDEDDASGEGVLSGLWRQLEKSIDPSAQRPTPLPQLPPGTKLPERPKQVRPPGRWVVYFSLAALPLFGIGQLFLPANNPEARRTGFEFLAVYLAAALSLLITTSFLGMRRYLRQRFVEMPASIAIGWVRFGVLLAVAVLILAMVFPRPGGANTVRQLVNRMTYKKHNASDHALPFNPQGEGSGAPGDQPNTQTQTSTDSKKPGSGGGGANNNSGAGGGGGGQGGQGGQSGSGGSSGGGNGSGGDGGSEDGKRQQSGKIPHGDQSANGAESDGGNKQVKAEDDGKEPGGNGNGQSTPGQPGQNPHPSKNPEQKQPVTPTKPIQQPEQKPGPEEHHLDWQRLLRILLFVALAALFVWFVVRYRRAIAHAIRSFVAAVMKFFRDLFQLRRRKQNTTVEQPLPASPPHPFADFENPFLTGKDKTWPPERLILYTYEAIRAWAKEQGIEIRSQETPREFCHRLAASFPESSTEWERFSVFYGYAAFAEQVPEDYEPETSHRLWQFMNESVMAISSETGRTA